MGAGHSGSTILGITLGNCEGLFYAGELDEWLSSAERPPWGAADRQAFWGAVKDRVRAEGLFGTTANRCIERSSALFRVDLWRTRRRLRAPYRRIARELLLAVADVAGARCVVDTSHFPLRARELRRLSGVELYLIYLVRDPRDVVASNVRELSRHEVAEIRWRTIATNANVALTHLTATLTFLSHPASRRIFVRHEDFLADPAGVTSQILEMLGSDAELPDLQALRIVAPLQGNQVIRSDTVAVRAPKPARRRRDLLTPVVQMPWSLLQRRLRPQARARAGHACGEVEETSRDEASREADPPTSQATRAMSR